MKKLIQRILSISLALVMLVSSVGVARISHICKMTLGGPIAVSKTLNTAEQHSCCKKMSIPQKKGCCSDVVTFFVNKIETTLSSSFKFQKLAFHNSVNLCNNDILNIPFFNSNSYFLVFHEHPHGVIPPKLFLHYSNFLI